MYTHHEVTSGAIVAPAINKFDRDAIEQHFVYLHHAAERAKVEGKLVEFRNIVLEPLP